jgi:hypothetical protein
MSFLTKNLKFILLLSLVSQKIQNSFYFYCLYHINEFLLLFQKIKNGKKLFQTAPHLSLFITLMEFFFFFSSKLLKFLEYTTAFFSFFLPPLFIFIIIMKRIIFFFRKPKISVSSLFEL